MKDENNICTNEAVVITFAKILFFMSILVLDNDLDNFNKKKTPMIDSMASQSSIDPSWLDQAADILYIKGIIVLELKNTFWREKSEIIKAYSNIRKHITIKADPRI